MKVILNISEKAIKKAKAMILLNIDFEEESINRVIEECKSQDMVEIDEGSLNLSADKEEMQMSFAMIAILQKLKNEVNHEQSE
jgi:hypothetical protein